ncbi:MAG TPA: hypothetical protein VHF00_00515, partial [Acidimicrobiales bacterium]|nr:hypothetical protein [Acidimicrobiales bacterium]
MPLLRATLLLDLVRLHDRAGNQAAARVEARRAEALLAGLDVVVPDGHVALLERFGGAAASTGNGAPPLRATLSREDRCWVVSCGDMRARLNGTKGLRYLAELLQSPGVERHALD